ncbi:hypothetical protein ACKRLN_06075 [Anaerococcus sp. DFU013_CI05]|uniref:hypothetical protein n=1 Tax=Anaerococcus sp. AH8042_DFU013_CI05 TaxID=3385202 RepID=UPI003A521141
MNELDNIEKFLKDLKFKKQTIGGVSEADVLAKVQKLSDLYAEAFKNQQIKYQSLLDDKNIEIKALRENSNE